MALLEGMMKGAKRIKSSPSVLTFNPHPSEVLNPSNKIQRLMTLREKLERFEALRIENVLVVAFDKNLSQLSPETFFDHYFVKILPCRSIHVGENFYFGHQRSGNIETLAFLCQKYSISLETIKPYLMKTNRVSSSAIRAFIHEGLMEEAKEILGYSYFIEGSVIKGDGRGNKIGFPTANIDYPTEKILPKRGVYTAKAYYESHVFKALVNVGIRPTFQTGVAFKEHVEVHLLDFTGDLYGARLKVEFQKRLRDEIKFGSLDELRAQIEKDIHSIS